MKFIIRADGNHEIGMGHVMRTLVLAKELKKLGNVVYACKYNSSKKDKYKPGIDKIISEGFEVELLKEEISHEELKELSADWLITDSYNVNQEYFDEMAKVFSKTAYIDDVNKFRYNVDLVINQNMNASKINYTVPSHTKLLLGVSYVMLREEFRNTKPKFIKDRVEHVLITVGGANVNCITEKILQYVDKLDYKFHVVIGPAFSKENIENIRKYSNKNISIYFNANMYELMTLCDIAISGAGSTLYELASCGVPTIGVALAENQVPLAEELSKLSAINYLGKDSDLNKERFIRQFNNIAENFALRNNMSKQSRKLLDGKGTDRILDAILS